MALYVEIHVKTLLLPSGPRMRAVLNSSQEWLR